MRLFAALLLFSFSAHAEVVTAVGKTMFAISHPADAQWEVSDKVCVANPYGSEICGTVIKVNEKAAFVKPDKPPTGLVKGNPARSLTSVSEHGTVDAEVSKPGPLAPFNLGVGFTVGAGFLLPIVDFEWAPTKKFAIGLMPGFASASSSSTVSATLVGAYATAAFYFKDTFDGFYLRAGLGGFSLSASDTVLGLSESSFLVSGFGALGYRIHCSDHFNIALSALMQYFSAPQSELVEISFTSVKPGGAIQFAYRF